MRFYCSCFYYYYHFFFRKRTHRIRTMHSRLCKFHVGNIKTYHLHLCVKKWKLLFSRCQYSTHLKYGNSGRNFTMNGVHIYIYVVLHVILLPFCRGFSWNKFLNVSCHNFTSHVEWHRPMPVFNKIMRTLCATRCKMPSRRATCWDTVTYFDQKKKKIINKNVIVDAHNLQIISEIVKSGILMFSFISDGRQVTGDIFFVMCIIYMLIVYRTVVLSSMWRQTYSQFL